MEPTLETSQKHFMNRVTPLSKILASTLFVLFPILTLYIGYQYGAGTFPKQDRSVAEKEEAFLGAITNAYRVEYPDSPYTAQYVLCAVPDEGTLVYFSEYWGVRDQKRSPFQVGLFNAQNELVALSDEQIGVLEDGWTCDSVSPGTVLLKAGYGEQGLSSAHYLLLAIPTLDTLQRIEVGGDRDFGAREEQYQALWIKSLRGNYAVINEYGTTSDTLAVFAGALDKPIDYCRSIATCSGLMQLQSTEVLDTTSGRLILDFKYLDEKRGNIILKRNGAVQREIGINI